VLVVDGTDEFFSFLCSYLSAMTRRRSLMIRQSAWSTSVPSYPCIINIDPLKSVLGLRADSSYQDVFPSDGAVYLIKQQAKDPEADEIIASIRETLIPNTYRLKAKFATTSGNADDEKKAVSAPDFPRLLEWFAAYAGSLKLSLPHSELLIDAAGMMAEASKIRETLLDHHCLQTRDSQFRAGFESTEHMVMKSLLLNGLRRSRPSETISVEEFKDSRNSTEDLYAVDGRRRDKPDILIKDEIWIEVETLRGLVLRGSNPFLELESKLRPKLDGMKSAKEVWIVVPSDIAVMAHVHLMALVKNLNHALGSEKVRVGFVDCLSCEPIFLEGMPDMSLSTRFVGATWRSGKRAVKEERRRWNDIAGYGDLKERLRTDLLDPLLEPEKYKRYGVTAANGLLLYGLPGCGKSLIGQVLAGEADLVCRFLAPSDMTSMWLGEGVMKIREMFDWAIKQAPCLLILDELDAVAPQRREHNMHSDEKRQVNELLTQLERIADKGVVVVATTNYVRGIDAAIQRSGRFDLKIPVFPPQSSDRKEIFDYYLSPDRLKGFRDLRSIDTGKLAAESLLFTPSDIKAVVHGAARSAVRTCSPDSQPYITTDDLLRSVRQYPRTIKSDMADKWAHEASTELGQNDAGLSWLREEVERVSSH